VYAIVRVHLSLSSRLRGASEARARDILIVKILYKCIQSILVYNLFLDRQGNILHTQHYFHTPVNIGCLHEIEIQIFNQSDWAKSRLDTNCRSTLLAILFNINYVDTDITFLTSRTDSRQPHYIYITTIVKLEWWTYVQVCAKTAS